MTSLAVTSDVARVIGWFAAVMSYLCEFLDCVDCVVSDWSVCKYWNSIAGGDMTVWSCDRVPAVMTNSVAVPDGHSSGKFVASPVVTDPYYTGSNAVDSGVLVVSDVVFGYVLDPVGHSRRPSKYCVTDVGVFDVVGCTWLVT